MSRLRGRTCAATAIALLAATTCVLLAMPGARAAESPRVLDAEPVMDFSKSGSFMIYVSGTRISIASWSYVQYPTYEGYVGEDTLDTGHASIGAGSLTRVVYDGTHMYAIDATFGIVIYEINTSYASSGYYDPSHVYLKRGQLAAAGLTALCKDGGRLYAINSTSLVVASVADPSAPVLVGTRAGSFVAVAGGSSVAYVIEGTVVKAIDASVPSLPVIGTHALAGPAGGLMLLGGKGVLVAGGAGTVELVDVSRGPSAMSRKARFDGGGSPMMHEYQDVLFASDGGKIKLIDISDTSSPKDAGTFEETYSEPPYFYPYGDVTRIWGSGDLLVYEKGEDVFIRSTREAMAIVEKGRAINAFHAVWWGASSFLLVFPILLVAGDVAHKKKQLEVGA